MSYSRVALKNHREEGMEERQAKRRRKRRRGSELNEWNEQLM